MLRAHWVKATIATSGKAFRPRGNGLDEWTLPKHSTGRNVGKIELCYGVIVPLISRSSQAGPLGVVPLDDIANNFQKCRCRLSFIDVHIYAVDCLWDCARVDDDRHVWLDFLHHLSQLNARLPLQHVVGNDAAHRSFPKRPQRIVSSSNADDVIPLFFQNGLSQMQINRVILDAEDKRLRKRDWTNWLTRIFVEGLCQAIARGSEYEEAVTA